MRVAFVILGSRIAPLFDTASEAVLVDSARGEWQRQLLEVNDAPLLAVYHLADSAVDEIVCGAISCHLESMLLARGVRVHAFVAGELDEVVDAYWGGRLQEPGFAMPGCRGRCRRRRRSGRRHARPE
jgi:predicted Fe-Mo cluster-binding NifX family protein